MKIQADNISFRVGHVTILEDIHMDLCEGSTTVLLGPNGAGKSSLLRLLSGVVVPEKGQVSVNGAPLAALSLEERARLLGVMTQRHQLDFPFTIKEVVEMGRLPHGGGGTVVQHLLETLALDGQRVYTSLSGGEKQLVQLARVFAQTWEAGVGGYLLLDEPMTALDLRHQQMIVKLLNRFSGEGTGQLIVMHDVNLAAEVADEIILMTSGRVVASGAPGEVMTEANLAQTFSTPMQVLTDGGQQFFRARLE
jgi:iron complex transport system ATP-binding protein